MRYCSIVLAAILALTPMACAEAPTHAPLAAEPRQASHVQPAKSLFDPARHMRVSEVKPGMKGYGLTVFHGTKIERFDVEVVSILKNFAPQSDMVLIRCTGDYLQHTGSIAGMSGSPIYLTDAAGHDRMIGAFAYGWPMAKDPVAAVQPIEQMLQLPTDPAAAAAEGFPVASADAAPESENRATGHSAGSWSLKDSGRLPTPWRIEGQTWWSRDSKLMRSPSALLGNGDDAPKLEPLSIPLMTAGLSPKVLEQVSPMFRAYGMVPLQGGGASSTQEPPATLEPGATLAVPLITGDVEMSAIGTCTEVLGDRVFAFGHSFNSDGPVSLPMGSGDIQGVIANLATSFKLGAITKVRGTLTTDGAVGVAGFEGAAPRMAPVELTVKAADGSALRQYHFSVAIHPKLTPMLVAAAFAGAIGATSDLPQFNTVDYSIDVEFSNGKTVRLANRAVNTNAAELFGDTGVVLQTACDNPFKRILVRKISGSIKVTPVARDAQLLDVNLPKPRFHPGEVVKAFVTYQPFHQAVATMPVEFELPRDLRPGTYQLIVSDAQRYFQDEQQSKPFRFTAENVNDVFAVLSDVAGIRENALYVRLMRQPDGVAIGRTAMPRLPSSRREILLGAGRSNTTAFVSSTVKTIPTEWVMNGSAEFAITVEMATKVLPGTPKPARLETIAPPPPKAEEPKKAVPPASAEPPAHNDAPTNDGKKETPPQR